MDSQIRFRAYFKDVNAEGADDDLDSDEEQRSEPVVGWRESDGAAMVLDAHAGRVVPAAERDGFVEVAGEDRQPPLAVIPGNGWRVRRTTKKNMPSVTHNAIAFLVYSHYVVPVTNLPMGPDTRWGWKRENWELIPPG